MSDDRLLEQLGRAEREAQAELPAEWAALAEGRADAAEVARLRDLAARDPHARELWARFSPLDPAFDEALAARLIAGRAGSPAPGSVVELSGAGDSRADRRGGSRAVGSRALRLGLGVAAVVLAAAAVLVIFWVPRAVVLPNYGLDISAADRAVRGAAAADANAYHVDSAITLILRPDHTIDTSIEVDAYYVQRGRNERWRPPMEISKTGSIRIDGRIAELLPGVTGEVTLLFFVRSKSAAGAGQVLVHTLVIAP